MVTRFDFDVRRQMLLMKTDNRRHSYERHLWSWPRFGDLIAPEFVSRRSEVSATQSSLSSKRRCRDQAKLIEQRITGCQLRKWAAEYHEEPGNQAATRYVATISIATLCDPGITAVRSIDCR